MLFFAYRIRLFIGPAHATSSIVKIDYLYPSAHYITCTFIDHLIYAALSFGLLVFLPY